MLKYELGRCGEIGKHARLKIVCPQGLVGSTPTIGTMPAPKLPFKNFLWSANLAYAVGLIATDGNLSSSGRHIILTSADRELLEKFCLCLGKSGVSISKVKPSGFNKNSARGKQAYRVQIGDVQLYNWLNSIGLMPNKTMKLNDIKIPDLFFRDFLRGWIDGDGSIFSYIDRYMSYKGKQYAYNRLYVQLVSASKNHLFWIHDLIEKLVGVRGAISPQQVRPNRNQMWRIRYSKNDSVKLLKWLYYRSDLPKLSRKFEIAKPFIKAN